MVELAKWLFEAVAGSLLSVEPQHGKERRRNRSLTPLGHVVLVVSLAISVALASRQWDAYQAARATSSAENEKWRDGVDAHIHSSAALVAEFRVVQQSAARLERQVARVEDKQDAILIHLGLDPKRVTHVDHEERGWLASLFQPPQLVGSAQASEP